MSTSSTSSERVTAPAGPLRTRVVPPSGGPGSAEDPALREDLLRTWVDVSEGGGSVGFVPPVDPAAVAAALDGTLARVCEGRDVLVVLEEAEDGAERLRAVGLGVLLAGSTPITAHWRTVVRLMVAPHLQGRGAGRRLLAAVHAAARDLGLEQLSLTVRDGQGLQPFYERAGYVVVGRHPGALRVGPGDDRDEVRLVVRL
ncbi:GNAT family N-acetyltransferase [uncultured Pseudokineococcus sp.]|uniref:GNAT family N-acetyltransferase n=1 Tax=uncultured Pseudokineococcus sp. TaxID=1642928 RepID=UPI00261B7630|nr:GNAT family N-acetyltransferase [uncultured Pseudokineococcus sp.]